MMGGKWIWILALLAAVALVLLVWRPFPQSPAGVQTEPEPQSPAQAPAESTAEKPEARDQEREREPEPQPEEEPELKGLLLRDLEGWTLVTEGPSEGAPREKEGEPVVPSWDGRYCREPEGCEAKVIDLSVALFRFTSEEMARKWLGQARYRAQQNAPYEEAFEVGDLQSDYGLVADFKGEEGFYLNDAEKAKGKEIWFRMGRIMVVMHSGVETDLLELAKQQGARIAESY